MLTNLKRRHLREEDDDSATTKALKKKLVEEIDRRWRVTDATEPTVLGAATDPRFKQLKWLSEEEKQQVHREVTALAESLASAGEDEGGSEAASPIKRAKTDREKERDLLLSMDEDDGEPSQGGASANTTECELDDFLKDRSRVDSGPLDWWRQNAHRYPKLATVAKRFLSIPDTSTPSERIFSKAGFIVNKSRSSLLPKHGDTLVFLSHNLKRVEKQ